MGIFEPNAADGHDRMGRNFHETGQALESERWGGVGLGLGRKNGPDGDVIDGLTGSIPDLMLVMGGQAEDRVVPDDDAGEGGRQVALAEVEAGSVGNPGDISTIVDDDTGTGWSRSKQPCTNSTVSGVKRSCS